MTYFENNHFEIVLPEFPGDQTVPSPDEVRQAQKFSDPKTSMRRKRWHLSILKEVTEDLHDGRCERFDHNEFYDGDKSGSTSDMKRTFGPVAPMAKSRGCGSTSGQSKVSEACDEAPVPRSDCGWSARQYA